jgi:hypothetical protein
MIKCVAIYQHSSANRVIIKNGATIVFIMRECWVVKIPQVFVGAYSSIFVNKSVCYVKVFLFSDPDI